MLLILYTNFFLCLIVAVNHGDAANAGDDCPVSGGCGGDLLCDQIHDKCLIKVPTSCTGNTDKCVSHASCGANSECACDTGYTVNTGLCEANIGTACNTSVACITDSVCDNVFGKCLIKVAASCAGKTDKCVSHASCGAGDVCACDTGYTDNTGLCEANIGTACNTSVGCITDSLCDNVFGKCLIKVAASCAGNTDKCVSHASCGTNNLCACDTGYTDNTGLCKANIGTVCNTSVGCVADSVCDNVFGKCLIKATASCVGNTDKCVSHASCGANNLCACDTGYTANTGLCEANIGTACNTSVGCIATSVCDNVFGKCLVKHGASCASPNADKCVSNAKCTNNLCGCDSGYTFNTEGLCEANLGTACNASVSCVPSYVCDVSGKCLIKAGASCANNIDKCVSNATCSEAGPTCGCNNGYSANDEGLCALNNTGKTPGISMSALVAMLLSGMCFSVLMM